MLVKSWQDLPVISSAQTMHASEIEVASFHSLPWH